MTINPSVVASHNQLNDFSCIPMAVEYVLKLLGRMPLDFFELQRAWQNKRSGNFRDFHNRQIAGIRFRQQFSLPRDSSFPIDDLFKTIDGELSAGRYVIISLASSCGWHMYVIYDRLPSGEYRAMSKLKGGRNIRTEDVRKTVCQMKGTDILTYELDGSNRG